MAGGKRRGLRLAIAGLAIWVAALIAGIVVLALTAIGPVSFVGDWDEEVVLDEGPSKVAMVEVVGEIVPGRGSSGGLFGGGGLGADDWVSQLRQAADDDDVEAVIVRLDTPGGAVVASDAVYRAVRELRDDKPVIVLMEDVAASGGYYIAAGANRIVANPATVTGSIGVIALFPNLEGTAEKLGVRPIVIKSGRLKDIGSPFRRLTNEERRILQRAINEAYGQFVDAVAEGRSIPEGQVRELADGRIYTGRQALANGLVDELGGLREAIEEAKRAAGASEGVRLVRYTRTFGFGDFLGPGFSVRSAVREALGEVRADVGLPRRPGLHYLWLG